MTVSDKKNKETKTSKPYEYNLVRTDDKIRKINSFLNRTVDSQASLLSQVSITLEKAIVTKPTDLAEKSTELAEETVNLAEETSLVANIIDEPTTGSQIILKFVLLNIVISYRIYH